MTTSARGAAVIVSIALLATVATQTFYIGVVSESANAEMLRKLTWTTEMVLFTIVAVAALPLVARSHAPMVWSAVAIAGLVNVIQVGMGLLEFPQAQKAADEQVFQTVLNGAFFLYFHGKALIGFAAIAMGIAALSQASPVVKGLGGLSILAGLAAVGLNLIGMANGMGLVFEAGAAGTAATALFALTVLVTKSGDTAA